jgi:hypothetical protein
VHVNLHLQRLAWPVRDLVPECQTDLFVTLRRTLVTLDGPTRIPGQCGEPYKASNHVSR